MPELPEVETLVRELRGALKGLRVRDVFVRNPLILGTPRPVFEKNLPGQSVREVRRIGKYIRVELAGNWVLWFHLGMTGRLFFAHPRARVPSHTHFALSFENFPRPLFYRDIRRFGMIALTSRESEARPPGVSRLGPEPGDWDPEDFTSEFKARRARIKNLLLNQNLIAGLGNIYADESLHRAGIHPLKRAHRIPRKGLHRLHGAICEVLEEAVRWGGSSIDDYRRLDGSPGEFQKFHRVYGREGAECPACSRPVRKIRLSGRSSSFCPQCQPS